jgi:hypothetical protein
VCHDIECPRDKEICSLPALDGSLWRHVAKGFGFDPQFGCCFASLDVDVARSRLKIRSDFRFVILELEVHFRGWHLLLVFNGDVHCGIAKQSKSKQSKGKQSKATNTKQRKATGRRRRSKTQYPSLQRGETATRCYCAKAGSTTPWVYGQANYKIWFFWRCPLLDLGREPMRCHINLGRVTVAADIVQNLRCHSVLGSRMNARSGV